MAQTNPNTRSDKEQRVLSQAEDVFDQASGTIRDAASSASDIGRQAYDYGARSLDQGSRAIGGQVGESPFVTILIAAAVGYFFAYLVHGSQPWVDLDEDGYGRYRNRR